MSGATSSLATREDSESAARKKEVQCWARHTIMDGRVVTYSTSFERNGLVPEGKKAAGHFEISASRSGVIVHRAAIETDWHLQTFLAAIHMANKMHRELAKCHGRPEWDQPTMKCKSCGSADVEPVKGHEPWTDDYFQCPRCNSTFPDFSYPKH